MFVWKRNLYIYLYPHCVERQAHTLLHLGDSAGSLQTLMATINKFSEFSGFTINWSKSILMALDPLGAPLLACTNQITVANSFKYLGVVVSPEPSHYLRLNFTPLLERKK